MTITPSALGQLSDHDLLAHVQRAAQGERRATAQLIALLMELDTRRLYLGEGFSSLFTFCTQALHLSEHAAYIRIETARAARRFPIILDLVAAGAVTLTCIRLVAPHLTPDNHREVLERARHKSKRDVELLVATLNPRADVPSAVRKLPCSAAAAAQSATGPLQSATDVDVSTSATPRKELSENGPAEVPRPAEARRSTEVKPLAPERYKIQITVSRETYQKLRRAQDLLRHSAPDGDPAMIVERALALLVAELERTKLGATKRPRTAPRASAASRHVPAAVRRTVWQRDGGRCAFQGPLGRCAETGFLEYHHVVPFAAGGETSTANLELRCRAHNQYEAQMYFGPMQAPVVRERRGLSET